MKRLFDLLMSLFLVILLLPPSLVIASLIKINSKGSVLFWSKRIGRNNVVFLMPKFRSMKVDTPVVASHLLTDPKTHITFIGKILRKTSLDEIPQLLCILKGEMSFVGPRPALNSQQDLIEMRTKLNIHTLLPGLTGWAQVNGRDELTIEQKVALDAEYLNKQRLTFDFYILLKTIAIVLKSTHISH